MNFLLLMYVLLQIISGAFEISDPQDSVSKLNTRLDDQYKRMEKFKNDTKKATPKPAFMAFMSSGNTIVRHGYIIQFNDVRLNINGHYDASQSYFRAPVSGLYYFAVTLGRIYNSGWANPLLIIEVKEESRGLLGTIEIDLRLESSGSLQVHVDANKRVWLRRSSIGHDLIFDYGPYSVFSGFLVTFP